ncbi:MAG: hypothetical protein KatS3mg051_0929 [Anaerolineae bacterium]|nr:MAG: hypothetical protein KatS3mg051_0929 [Anaerolineae bacterium]
MVKMGVPVSWQMALERVRASSTFFRIVSSAPWAAEPGFFLVAGFAQGAFHVGGQLRGGAPDQFYKGLGQILHEKFLFTRCPEKG